MKKNIRIPLLGLLTVLIFSSCEKNKFSLKETNFIDGKAQLKVNFVSSYRNNPAVQLKLMMLE